MKPSHLTTPRTLAECTFVQGYTSQHLSDRPTLIAFAVQAVIGLSMIAATLLAAFGYLG